MMHLCRMIAVLMGRIGDSMARADTVSPAPGERERALIRVTAPTWMKGRRR